MHDSRLNHKVTALASVTPYSIRKAAREVAAEGLAGREALVAAQAGRDTEQEETLLTNFLLLLGLVEQMEPGEAQVTSLQPEEKSVLEARAKRAIARMAPRVGRSPEVITAMLEGNGPGLRRDWRRPGRPRTRDAHARWTRCPRRPHAETTAWSQSPSATRSARRPT